MTIDAADCPSGMVGQKGEADLKKVLCVALTPMLLQCGPGGLPPIHPYTDDVGYSNPLGRYVPLESTDAGVGKPALQGSDYCRDLESRARMNAVRHDTNGFVFGGASLAAAGTGIALTAADDGTHGSLRKGVEIGLPLLAAALVPFAIAEFQRAGAADEFAGAATTAASATNDDKKKNDLCLTAHSAWDSSRASASKALLDKLAAESTGGAGGTGGTTATATAGSSTGGAAGTGGATTKAKK
jgi:hypothetical protein